MTYTSGKSSHLRVSNLKRTQYEINAHAHTHTHIHTKGIIINCVKRTFTSIRVMKLVNS